MDTPTTPIHVAPDVEVNLPDQPFVSDALELNPDLDDDEEMSSTPDSPDSSQLEDVDTTVKVDLWTLPFDDAYELQKKHFALHSNLEVIAEWQQSKFINYLDGELLQVQRRFIKNQAETEEIYLLNQLLQDVAKILDLIWYLINTNNKLYGQEEYFIKIAGDLEDWVAYYRIDVCGKMHVTEAHLLRFFSFFQTFDTRLSFLIDGYTVGLAPVKMSSTELIRLTPIISRLRLEIVSKFDLSRAQLTHMKELGSGDANALLNKLDVEIGRLFEGVLERI